MILGSNSIRETHYDVLSIKEDASHEEIRTSYKTAILNSHPDKLHSYHETGDRFLRIQKAWEILSDPKSRAVYDSELRDSRQDVVASEDIVLEDMMIEDAGEVMELFYQCRCGDHFSVDSLELGKMGYTLFWDGTEISLRTPDAFPASIVLPCGSCSLLVRLMINPDIKVTTDGRL
ncbi:DPH4 homolog [Durio zibethinus]|uniref:DPH4 homolog n=1 Tax=Durio zibethinus TaxID=66656 RepID=A0A6P6AV73_DURZI|nr:DPH4 homolog [Durio zibethinus]